MERPPSVDALARSLAGSGLPHALLVDVARAAIADGAVADAPARADALRRTLLTPVVNATGVLLHTNLGRAPLAHHQSARAQSLELDLTRGERGSRQRAVGGLLAGCAVPRTPSWSTTTRLRCCSSSPPSPGVAPSRSVGARASRSAAASASRR